jgi:serine/threonine-protein kinase
MGSLYLARDPAIDRLVAIKLLRRGFDTEALRERFAREARAVGRLRHPNIVTIFDVGEHDGDPFIAMEFLAGETLWELIRHGAGLSLARRLKLLEELCDGLAYAHRAGLVHRDVKPANLMVDAEGVLKILDFGIVRIEESGMTQAGVLVGTVNYMSPEQVLGTGVDHRSDIFAVGLVAYELLTGRQAFVGTMKDGLLRRIPNVEIEPLSAVLPGLDPDVVAIVEKALQKNPEDRYQELAKMRNDLTRARQRIEVEEERAAVEAASAAAETAFIAEEPTAPGVSLAAPIRPGHALIADAERALAEGRYRIALTIAGRAAAVDPHDRTPSSIVARAEAGLLERGRTVVGSQQAMTPAVSAAPASGAAAAPVSSPSTIAQSQRATYLAFAVALIALMVAGFAVWSQVRPSEPRTESTDAKAEDQAPPVVSAAPGQTAPGTSSPTIPEQLPASPPASTSLSQSVEPEPSAARPPESPDVRSSKSGGTRPESTVGGIRQPARSEGRRSDNSGGRATSTAAPAVERDEGPAQQGREPAAVQPGRTGKSEPPPVSGVPLREPGAPPSALPGAVAPRPTMPPPPRPAETPVEVKTEVRPPRDPRAEAEAAIRVVLQRYEAAWEALDFNALKRVQASADARIAANMRDMREYAMDVKIQSVDVSPDARTATAVCQITYRVQGPIGSRQTENRRSTFSFERFGENWMIASIR